MIPRETKPDDADCCVLTQSHSRAKCRGNLWRGEPQTKAVRDAAARNALAAIMRHQTNGIEVAVVTARLLPHSVASSLVIMRLAVAALRDGLLPHRIPHRRHGLRLLQQRLTQICCLFGGQAICGLVLKAQ